jgi:glucose/arabinose dehydrogenase
VRLCPLFAALAVLAACGSPPAGPAASAPRRVEPPAAVQGPAAPEVPDAVALEVTEFASGLQAPWALAFAPDGRVFVSERETGRILELAGGEAREIQRLSVQAVSEAGLLGLAVSPDWETDELLYAYFTSPQGDNRIVRFRPGSAPEPVLTGIPAARVHDGGRLAFGPDGMLYATTGDATVSGSAQDVRSLGGKILRMTPDGQPPPDNPFPGSLVYSYGHRNVQGIAWTADGGLYITEYGPDRDDEINRIQPGANYGWPLVTGQAQREGLTDPLFVVPDTGDASWSGAAILVGGAIPQWEGDLFAAGLRGERLYRFDLAPDGGIAGAEQLLVGEHGRLRDAVQAPDGSLWLLTNNTDGRGSPEPADDRVLRLGPPPA